MECLARVFITAQVVLKKWETGGETGFFPENYHGSPENRPLEVQRS